MMGMTSACAGGWNFDVDSRGRRTPEDAAAGFRLMFPSWTARPNAARKMFPAFSALYTLLVSAASITRCTSDMATALGLACLFDPSGQQVRYFPAMW
jgi:hypothetical protein